MSSISPVTIVMDQVKAFSFTDLLAFQVTLAAHIKSEYKKVAKTKRVKDPNAPKRELGVGMLAWKAYVKDLISKQPELFVEAKPTEKQQIASKYKQEHIDEYTTFVASYKAEAVSHEPVAEVKPVAEPVAEVKPVAEPVVEVKPVVKADKPKKVKEPKTA